MKFDINDLLQERKKKIDEMKALLEAADGENRAFTDDENTRYDDAKKEVETIDVRIAREKKLKELEARGEGAHLPDPSLGMSEGDIQQYSLCRAILASATGDWSNAGLELEASREVGKKFNKEPRGFFVPYDFMTRNERKVTLDMIRSYLPAELRDMVVGTDSAGGYLKATDLLSQNFIEMLRNKMMVQQAGAWMLSGLVGDVTIPKQTGGATAYWVAESGAPTEAQQTLGQVALSPKTVGAFTDISRKLLKQSSIDVEAFVRSDISTVLALAIDLASLHGTGANNQPTGIAATSGIGSVAGGTNGLAPAESHIIDLETEVAVDNADIGRLAYMSNAKVRGKLKKVDIGTDTGLKVWDRQGGRTPLNGYPALITNQVSSALTKGTSSGVCSAIFFANWADLIIAMWGVLDILVDPFTGGTAGTVRVIGHQDVDVGVRHAEAFAAMLDALTA